MSNASADTILSVKCIKVTLQRKGIIVIVIIHNILIFGITKQPEPLIIREGVVVRKRDRGEPIIEDDVKGGCDSTGIQIEDQRDGGGVNRGRTHVDGTFGPWFPAG